MHRLLAILSVLLGLGFSASVSAQVSNQKLAEINRVAMEAYNSLDMETARSTLEDAIRSAERAGTHGAALARTYASLGVVVVGGFGETNAGVDAFVHALKEDPNVEPDPIVATPDIMVAFTTAKKRVGGGARQSSPARGKRSFEGNLNHEPAAEQLSQTAVPVFVSKDGLDAEKVKIFYRSLGMSRPKSAEMQETENGWAYLIPCTDVFEPSVEYFIIAEDDDGEQVGNAGTPQRPIAVPIVSTRTQEAPSLPGQPPPTQCGAVGTIEECPPGLPGCSTGTAQLGDTCRSNSDCASGLMCMDEFCALADDYEARSKDDSGAPKWFLDVSFGIGGTLVKDGKTPDRNPSPKLVADALSAMGRGESGEKFLAQNGYNCNLSSMEVPNDTGGTTLTGTASNCKVAVEKNGMVPVPLLNVALGRFVTPRLAVALTGRIQMSRGQGTLAGLAIGARGEYQLTQPKVDGLHVGALLGVGVGTVQARAKGSSTNPFATSAPVGGIGVLLQLGVRAGYRFNRYFGIVLTPAVTLGLPRLLTAIDLVGGLEFAY